jgi:uncharacterized protein YwgA
MNNSRILLKLVLDEIGLGRLDLSTFSKRLVLQKKIYLLQISGLDLRYRYNWYLHGPYCPSLTEDAFLLKDELNYDEDYEEYTLSLNAKSDIERAQEVWEAPESVNLGTWLELLASLHYLKHIAYWPGKSPTKEQIFKKLVKTKPQFAGKSDLVERGWQRLNQLGLLGNRTLE